MKNYLYRLTSCVLLVLAAVTNAYASFHVGETQSYKICPGDTIEQMGARKIQVWSDTIIYDTIITTPSGTLERDTMIQVYDVNVYPVFDQTEYKRINAGDSLVWRDTVLYEAGDYERIFHSIHGCDSIYRVHLTVKTHAYVDTLFTLCDDESLTFHGKTYVNAGEYQDVYTADTTYRITIVKHPSQVYLQTGVLDRTHPYYWQYILDGEPKTDTIYEAGVYEHTSHNETTGCNDTYRLVLTKDETAYHFIENVTVCENERFDWRGRTELNRQGIGQTIHYFDKYRTKADQDSIYELILTVNPVPRIVRTIPFCGSYEWKGKTYTESETIIDTLTSMQYHCDSIVTTILKKGVPVTHRDTINIVTGETLTWHGMTITSEGDYQYIQHSDYDGCDNTYILHVNEKEPAHTQSTRSEWTSICQGDGYEWHNKTYYNSGVYYDTIKTGGGEIDSLYILYLTVNKTYTSSERVTFVGFPVVYRDSLINEPGAYEFHYQTVNGCDSAITSYIDLDIYKDIQTVTICPGQFYIWSYDGNVYTTSGTYIATERTKDDRYDSIMHVLNLNVNYVPETYIAHTMCKGEQYTFADQTLTESGVYRHAFHTTGGCDSVVVLSLNVVNPDTSYTAIQREAGATYEWNGKTYYQPGIYYFYGTSKNGCDSVAVLNFTYNQVDTIADTLTVCPNELPFVWNGIEANQTKVYTQTVQQPNGTVIFYSLNLTVRDVTERDTTFAICAGGSISFNGETYTEAGVYRSYLTCDTLINVRIIVNQPVVYETQSSLGGEHGYTWTYWSDGVEHTEVITTPGTYEYENPNPETGCNDIYRLILTKDATSYHFTENLTICEGDDFEWHGLSQLGRVLGTSIYTDAYKTRAGKDSIYTLNLTVVPTERTVRTIVFCGSYEWNGKVYSEDAVVYDTTSLANGCYRIERINLDKAQTYFFSSTKELVQGEVYQWQGLDIETDGVYRREYTTVNGCDSIYEITVTIIPATPQTNQYSEELSACAGDTILWHGKNIWKGGTYVDTVYKAGTETVDSIFALKFTVWPAPKDTIYQHRYTCVPGASIRYQGEEYLKDTAVVKTLKTIYGCDSIVKVFMHFNTSLNLSRTDSITDEDLPYRWTYQLADPFKHDTIVKNAGTYTHRTEAEGGCEHIETLTLVVLPTYHFILDTTICELDLPFHWLNGPADHVNDALTESKQYEWRYTSVDGTDSIYRLTLTIEEAPRVIERYDICENKDTIIYGKSYFDKDLYPVGTVIRDTVRRHNAGTICDSIIYVEINKIPQRHIIEERIKHVDETINWRGETITAHTTHTYKQEGEIDPATGCEMIYELRVIAEDRKEVTICKIDTAAETHPDKKYPYVWEQTGEQYTTTGIYTDTLFDASTGHMLEFHSLDLTIVQPYDTTVYVHGCDNKGAYWRDELYWNDTTFVERIEVTPYDPEQPCDSVFHVNIIIDKTYTIRIDTTLCEYQLPLIIGRVNPDTIWEERNFRHVYDTTKCGCDSIIEGHLTIIPKLAKNDSTFICEGDYVVLGDTVNPAFLGQDGGKWDNVWYGKWKGVTYTEDTIVWDCDHRYFHHIIRRPTQKIIPEKTFYLCHDDSLQLFWPYDTTWFSHDTVYEEHRPMDSIWTDPVHGITYKNEAYTCDSVTRWYIKKLPLYQKDTTAHRLLGDSIWWGGAWRYYTGTYDSIKAPSPDTNSYGDTCMYIYPLHLIMDSAYYFRDTVELCSKPGITHEFVWAETGHKQYYTVGSKDSLSHHYFDSLLTYDRRDSIYDLCVNYRMISETLVLDTICEDTKYRFNAGRGTIERWLDQPGRYVDTLTALNGCDSIVTLQLYVRNRIVTKPKEVMITDRDLPYAWHHTWMENGLQADSTDILRASGLYTCVLPSIHGCDSIDSLYLTVHQTHVFRDTIDVCHQINKSLKHTWYTGYVQDYTTPLADDTAFYADTLSTRIKWDSIYVLCVNFHQTYETLIFDTICEGDQYRYNGGNGTIERWFDKAGRYVDTLTALNGCDSIVTLQLYVRNRIVTKPKEVMVTDRDLPYAWHHTWWENGQQADSTDMLRASGLYTCVLPSIHGCDSIDSLYLTVHQTHVFRDTIDVCHQINKSLKHTWYTGYVQDYTTPLADDTAFYADTLSTRIKWDSIYVLCVNFHQTYETLIFDTICEGETYRYDAGNGTIERWVDKAGRYVDTLTALNGCDSIVTLQLYVWPSYPTSYKEVDINVRDTPYAWVHTWIEAQQLQRDTDFISIPGMYGRELKTIHGCDSIDSLILRIHENYIFYDSISICADETPYTWYGPDGTVYKSDIYESGEHIRRWQTANGFGDSTRVLRIEVKPIMHSLRYDTLCYGDSILFGLTQAHQPRYLHQSGVYYDTLRSIQYGCDSIIEMRLNVFGHYLHTETRHIMRTDTPYVWYHYRDGSNVALDSTILYAEGSYAYNFFTSHGCDSIDSLTLVLHDNYLYRDSVVICQDEVPYIWYGADGTAYKNDIWESGEYIYSVRKQDGYSDSTMVRKVTVLPIMHSLRYDTLCYGDSLLFGLTKAHQPRYLHQTGIYYDTLRSIQYGCDSIIEMRLNVFPNLEKYHTPVDITDKELPYIWYHIPDGMTNPIDSTIINGNGTFEYTFKTIHGCDSIDHLTVIVHPNYYFRDSVQICSDAMPYTWYGPDGTVYKSDIYTTDTYVHHMRTADGYADSVYTRYVDVQQVKFTLIRDNICADANGNNFYTFAGQNLKVGGVYRDTLSAANGCDSIVELHLSVNRPYYSFREEHIIEGQEVKAYGQTFTTDTVYTHNALTPNGCDSTMVLKVVVHPMVDTTVTVCSNELPYIWINKWNGQATPLYAAGLYRNDTTMVNGQRMFYGLRLIVDTPSDTTIYREICEGDTYNFNNRYLGETGEYRDTLANANGCDSVIILHLNVLRKYYHSIEHTIYEGDSVLFESKYYKEPGAYPIRFTSSFGCDSVVELRLMVIRLFDDSISVCANNLPYIWRDKTIYESGVYRDTVINSEGKETPIGIKVTVLPTARAAEPVNVTICEGDFYKFGNRVLSEQGSYYDTLTAVNGCDSIVMLSLQVMPAKYQTTTKRIFEGDSALFNGVWYKESGVYEYRELNEHGCTDTYQLILTVLKTFNIDTTAVICDNELPFVWRGYEYNESGDYALPIAWTDSSRVVKTLHLTVNTTFYIEQNINICAGDTFLFKGKKYYESGYFYDTIPATTGCDSIKKYIVAAHPTFDKVIDKHISDKEPFNFHGRELSQTGTYEWTGKTIHGCDSMEHLILTVHPSFFQSDTIDLCQSDSLHYPYVWKDENGRIIATISQTGVYNDSVLTEYGFDSVHQLVVNVHPSYLYREQYEIGEGEILKIHGRNISEPAIYYDTLRTIYGCDSIYHIVVNQKRTREFTWTKSICQGDVYEFFGRKLNQTGQYKYTSQYKDSIVTLILTVNPVTYSEKRVVITDKSTSYIGTDGQTYYSYIYDGKMYDQLRFGNNLFSEQYVNQYGCDSIARLIIVVTNRYSEWTPIPLCPGSEIKIDGDTIRKAGLYTFLRRSRVTGEMDSLYRVEVYDAPAYEFDEKRTICDGDTLYYGKKIVTRGGKQDVVLKTVDGCDSIYHLDITVNPSYHFDEAVTIFDYQSFTWKQNHKTYTTSGTYEKSYPTIHDCDSTYILNLTVIPTMRQHTIDTICIGQEYIWRGDTIREAGFYTDTVAEKETLRSIIYTLSLAVLRPTIITSAEVGEVCADAESFDIHFTYSGAKPMAYSIYFNQLAKNEGFRDIINEPFISEERIAHALMPVKTDVVYQGHTTYVRPNRYSIRLVLDNGVCGISRSDSLTLLIKYPSWIIEQNWDDIVVPLRKELNGGYEFTQTNWYVNGTLQPNNGLGYLHSDKLRIGDEVVMEATRKGESFAIRTCPLIITEAKPDVLPNPVIVYPTQAPRHTPVVTIKAPRGGQFAIYSSTGSLLSEGEMDEGATQVTLPSVSGIYFIRTTQGKDTETHKVLLY